MISQATIQSITDRIDILDIVGGFVKLKRRGANYLGLCPFHHERTPSFTVSPAKEIFKCCGCGKSGNSISFVMEHEKLSYVEALRWLAARYNIEIEETQLSPEKKIEQQTSESLLVINEFARKFFIEQLRSSDHAQDYLKERGFSGATIENFSIGYAPDSRDLLAKTAISQQFNTELLKKAGLIYERNGDAGDMYRDRIVFPIHNVSGKVIGFGARLLKSNDKAPKYINTPENEIYVKSRILYGLYFSRQSIDRMDECYMVEGYTDVVSLHQAGVTNVVASGGTSLTVEQLRLVKKYTKNLTIIYDGDSAGIKAALRGLDLALDEGLEVKLVLLPQGEDPDSYVKKEGAQAFFNYVTENKKDFILFQLEVLLKEAGSDAARKAAVVTQMAETLARIERAEDFTRQQDYIRRSAQLLQIDESGLTNLVNKFIRNRISLAEKKLPFEEAQVHAENAKKGEDSDFSDHSFSLLYRDELQEREIARVLLEYGNKRDSSGEFIAHAVLADLPDDDLFDSAPVLKFLGIYREEMAQGSIPDKAVFLYHSDPDISVLSVSLLQFPYQLSDHWKRDLAQSTGYMPSLFEQDYKSFISSMRPENEEDLMRFLKTQKDTTWDQVESAVTYLKLRKIKRLLFQNQADLEKASAAEQQTLFLTHAHLKQMEMQLTRKLGTVVYR